MPSTEHATPATVVLLGHGGTDAAAREALQGLADPAHAVHRLPSTEFPTTQE
ncbi:hypothetical protein [Pseudorhodoferax sp.]|uniref:hypothetical protein n=1 Tax=Pseudorhodoferax sp. TaxID=1993553 RepID=UPI002DD668D5|nr:hypothetical protein [Pseudorhodoferax sp.]